MFENPAIMSAFAIQGIDFTPVSITKWLVDGEIFEAWGRKVQWIIVQDIVRKRNFTIESEKISFVGDVIFGKRGTSRSPEVIFPFLGTLFAIKFMFWMKQPFCAHWHGPTTTVGKAP